MSEIFFKENKYNKFIILFTIIILSVLIFRGRLGSDDLEVFNFLYNFDQFNGSFNEYLQSLKNDEKIFYSEIQKHRIYTFHHRFVWIIQTGIIFFISKYILLIFSVENYFILQYLCGLIITIQTLISLYIFTLILYEKKLNKKLTFFCSYIIFFGTGVICLFTGQYIESTAILLVLLYIKFSQNYIRLLFSSLLILIKPFYILIIFSFSFSKISKENFFLNKKNLNILNDLISPVLVYFLIFFLIKEPGEINNYFGSQNPTKNIIDYFINLFNFYFSFGAGILFTSIVPIILICIGSKKESFFKFLIVILMSFVLSFWEGFHGGVQGIRYLLPFLFIFIDEYIRAINKIYHFRKTLIIVFLFGLTLLNLSSLEYRNFAISEYENKTIENFKPAGAATLVNEENNKYRYYQWPIWNISFNNLIFSNEVTYSKIVNKDKIKVNNLVLKPKNIFPQTGLGRLIYIKQNNIELPQKNIIKFIDKYYLLIKIIYYILIISFISVNLINLSKILKSNEKN